MMLGIGSRHATLVEDLKLEVCWRLFSCDAEDRVFWRKYDHTLYKKTCLSFRV